VTSTAQTWTIVVATLGAAFLGAIVAYLGARHQQKEQAKQDAKIRKELADREARIRLESGLAELLAAGQDLMIGVQAIRQAHERRTQFRFWMRFLVMVARDWPHVNSWRELAEPYRAQPLFATAIEAERNQLDESRTMTLDLATVVTPKANRYLAIAALLTLGEDRVIADAVRELTPKVTGVMDAIGGRKRDVERLTGELQSAMVDFRDLADKRLGNVKKP
jgi:hypothetical protein